MNKVTAQSYFPKSGADTIILECLDWEFFGIQGSLKMDDEKRAFCILAGDASMIVLNMDAIEVGLLPIVVAHELGHVACGVCEEDADEFALILLEQKDRDELIRHWKERHGHGYSTGGLMG